MKLNREGRSIVTYTVVAAVTVLAAAWLCFRWGGLPGWPLWIIGGLLMCLACSVAWFFRDPDRARIEDGELVFSPADGKVVVVEEVFEKEFLKEDRIQVSVFMSLTNVHINWFPVGGKVVYRNHHHGKYMVAWHPKSSEENERATTVVDTGRERILFRQIAGLLARRIVNYAEVGHEAEQNAECGFIKFGSRVDVFLPPDAEVLVKVGDRVTGSQTPVARLKREC